MTLVEMLVAVGLGSMLVATAGSLWLFGSRSFVAMGNYASLDTKSRNALDLMSRDIRQATRVTGFQNSGSTRWLQVSNAAEAMPDGGRITIISENRHLDSLVRGYDEIRPGDHQRAHEQEDERHAQRPGDIRGMCRAGTAKTHHAEGAGVLAVLHQVHPRSGGHAVHHQHTRHRKITNHHPHRNTQNQKGTQTMTGPTTPKPPCPHDDMHASMKRDGWKICWHCGITLINIIPSQQHHRADAAPIQCNTTRGSNERNNPMTDTSPTNTTTPTNTSYQDRVITEKTQLCDKIAALRRFNHSETYAAMDPADRKLLSEQCSIMQQYADILTRRIARFKA